MKAIHPASKQTTAIPVRFWRQRERVLRILARWERTSQQARFVRPQEGPQASW